MDSATIDAAVNVASNDSSPGMEAKMDAFWATNSGSSDAADSSASTTTEEPEAPAQQAAEDEGESAVAQDAAADDAASQPADVDTAEVPAGDVDDDIDIDKLLAAGSKSVKLDSARFRTIYQNHKMAREIGQYAPSVEAAKTNYQRAGDLRHMYADYTSGTPEGATEFLTFWKSQDPAAFSTMATRALEMAPPEVHQQVRESVTSSLVEEFYADAAESKDPMDLYRAQMLDYRLNGKFRTDQQLNQAPKPDPVDQRLKDIEAREKALRDRDVQAAEGQWNAYRDNVISTASNGLDAAITAALKPVEADYKSKPMLLEALHDKIRSKVVDSIKADSEWVRQFNLDLNAARRSQDDVTAKALVDTYVAKATGLVRNVAKPLMSQSAVQAVAASNQKHEALAKSQNKKEVIGGGRPAPVTAPQVPKGASVDAKMAAYWKQVDAAGASQPRSRR